ncbi:MAG: hypothetical protein E7596_00275 [Ruminococcaceae bacterium]|nr:hypothetical protein [Oscillospiraceae bacterium]
MARKKQLMTLSQLTEEGNGTLIPENENKSSEKEALSEAEMGEEIRGARKKRGRVKRRNGESFKKSLANILGMVIAPETVAEAVKKTPLGADITYQEAILIAQVLKASNGDTQAAVFLRDTSGNKLKEMQDKELDVKSFEDF